MPQLYIRKETKDSIIFARVAPVKAPKASAKSPTAKSSSTFDRGVERTKEDFKQFLSKRKKGKGLSAALKREPLAVQNFARRAIKAGAKPKRAISQGRVLFNENKIDDDGKRI